MALSAGGFFFGLGLCMFTLSLRLAWHPMRIIVLNRYDIILGIPLAAMIIQAVIIIT